MESNPVLVKYTVLPNTDYTWEVELTAPTKVGRYTAYFRMRTNDGKKFGHKVWCDIQVVEGIKEEKVVISVNQPLPPVEIEQLNISVGEAIDNVEVEIGEPVLLNPAQPEPVYPSLHDFMFGEKQAVNLDQPIDLSVGYAQLPVKTPRMIYFEQVAQEKIEQLRNDLTVLYEFGFVEFEVNKKLLVKHKNVDQVAGVLLEGRLSESMINQVYKH